MIACKRWRESRKAWAQRIGVYASALWLLGRAQAIPELVAPQLDLGALESEIRVASLRSVRKPVSVAARLDAQL